MVTVSMDWDLMLKFRGSDTARAPLGMEIVSFPENVTFWRVEGWIWWMPAVSFAGRAIVTAVMGRFVTPKALEILRRIWEAPTDMWRVWRMVLLTKTAPVWFCIVMLV